MSTPSSSATRAESPICRPGGSLTGRVDPLPASRAPSGLVGGLVYHSLVPGAVADVGFEMQVSAVIRLRANVLQFGLV